MTNKDKYRQIFGLNPDITVCPAQECKVCPVSEKGVCDIYQGSQGWWNSEYKTKESDKMSVDEIIHDLEVLEEYFADTSDGIIPISLPEAIKILEQVGK